MLVFILLLLCVWGMERPAKLQKLNDFRRNLPHCSASALSSVLEAVKAGGLPEGSLSRKTFRCARDMQMLEPTPFGTLLQSVSLINKDGVGVRKMYVAHPFAALWKAVNDCKPFSTYLLTMLKQMPSSPQQPWHMVMYSDEVTPGNPLSTMNNRKFHAVYWSFLELGVNALSREEAWFCIAAEYSTNVSAVSAGLSQVFGALVKLFFDKDGYNLGVTGILLDFGDESIRLFAKLGGVLQDGGAHKSVWHSRGDAASRYCLLCKNLFTAESKLCDEDGNHLLCCNVVKLNELVPATSRDIRAVARHIESKAGTLSREQFSDLQQALGMTHHPHGLLLDRTLDDIVDPVEVYMHDWMHALCVDGVCNLVIYLLFESFIDQGHANIYQVFSTYVANWRWPMRLKQKHSTLPEIFTEQRKDNHRRANHIKCQASEMLSLIPVMAIFTMHVLMKMDCTAECNVWLALVDVVDLIVASSRITVPSARLLAAVEKFLQLFVDVWGHEWMVPKFHWLLHLPGVLSRFLKLLNCFCLERKHRVAKRYATDLTKTKAGSQASLLKEVVNHHFGQLHQPECLSFDVGLVNPKAPSRRLKLMFKSQLSIDADIHQVRWSNEARFSTVATCEKGDVVLFKAADNGGTKAGMIQLHCSVEGVVISVLKVFTHLMTEAGTGYAVFVCSDEGASLIETECIVETVVYNSSLANNRYGIILPIEFR
jgi:hypothetical protein